jgi:hypothetical protein
VLGRFDGIIDEIAMFEVDASFVEFGIMSELINAAEGGSTLYSAETMSDRARTVLRLAGWPDELTDVDRPGLSPAGAEVVMRAFELDGAWAGLQRAGAAGYGAAYITADGRVRVRAWKDLPPGVIATLGNGPGEIPFEAEPQLARTDAYDEVRVAGAGGDHRPFTASLPDSPNRYRRRRLDVEIAGNLFDVFSEPQIIATEILDAVSVERPILRSVRLNPKHAATLDVVKVLELEAGLRARYRTFAGDGFDMPARVGGIAHRWDEGGTWRVDLWLEDNLGPIPEYVPLGYAQHAVAVAALTPPDAVTMTMIQAEGGDFRWRDDGVAATTTVGTLLLAGETLHYYGEQAAVLALSVARVVAGIGKLNVSYYRGL